MPQLLEADERELRIVGKATCAEVIEAHIGMCGFGAGGKGHMARDDHLQRLLQQPSYVTVSTNCGFGYLNQRQHL